MTSVGVLLLVNTHLRSGRAMGSAQTFDPPSVLRTVPGAHSDVVSSSRSDDLADAYVREAESLVRERVDIVTTNCGYCIRYQEAVASTVDGAIALSSLLLVDLLVRVYGDRLGILTFDAHVLAAVSPSLAPPVADVQACAAWRELAESEETRLDLARMQDDLLAVAAELVAAHGLRALLLECTGMFPFKHALEASLGVRCFDLVDLIEFLQGSTGRERDVA